MADQPLPPNQVPPTAKRKNLRRAAAEEPTGSVSRGNTEARPAKPVQGAASAAPGKPSPAQAAPTKAAAANGATTNAATTNGAKPNGAKPSGAAAHTAASTAQAQRPANAAAHNEPKFGVRADLEEMAEQGAFLLWLKGMFKTSPAWLASMVVHAAVLLVMALIVIKIEQDNSQELISESLNQADEPLQDIQEVQLDDVEQFDLTQVSESVAAEASLTEFTNEDAISQVVDTSMATQNVALQEFSDLKANPSDLLAEVGSYMGSDVSGRGDPKAKKALLAQYGGNEASEKAVAMALEWLANHQLPDGSWSFDHRLANHPNGLNPGSLANARTASTGMALLPFLGAGMTHKQGKYKQTVHKGLYYLCSQMEPNGALNAGGGRMYGHGLCAIALCEAYAMTQDKSLRPYAELSLQFIVMAQDRQGGGWRYTPGQPGDTSVVGWQLMALKSGHMGYLKVPPQVIAGVNNFLNTVQSDGGAAYGYTGPGRGPATSAIGLLCRMYLGWDRENPALERGAQFLSKMGPHKTNMYFNYYATQVLHHYEGELWYKWNEVMRDQLVNTQVKDGHEKGSWFFDGGHGAEQGGRLYSTAMAAMTLEVYYRHLPIYRKQSTQDFAN